MSTDTELPIYPKHVIEFKSSSFSVPVLVVHSTEKKQIQHQLKEKIAQAPEFFKNSPLVIDLKNCSDSEEQAFDVASLIEFLHSEKLFPIGISNANEELNKIALEYKIPQHILHGSQTEAHTTSHTQKTTTEIASDNSANTSSDAIENKLITHPIRSGQRIYVKGDLTILSHVSAGAEVMAEGNIHVYGALRGKALAGVQGDTKSRIFCSALQAELVSIAGHYKISEELDSVDQHQPAQVFLKDQALIINNI